MERTNYYVGRRTLGVGGDEPTNLEVRVVDRAGAHELPRREARFDWGADTPGARALAYALIHDLTGMYPTEELCSQLVDEILAHLDQDGFVLADTDLLGWLDARTAA